MPVAWASDPPDPAGTERLSRAAAASAGDLIGAYRRVFIGILP